MFHSNQSSHADSGGAASSRRRAGCSNHRALLSVIVAVLLLSALSGVQRAQTAGAGQMPDNGDELLSGSAVPGAYATRTVNDMRQLKAAMLLYYFYNQDVWPTEADVDKLDQYCDYPIVRVNPPRYAAVMIKNGSIGVRLIPKNGDASVQAVLAKNADEWGLWSNADGGTAYESGSEVWMRVYNIPQAEESLSGSAVAGSYATRTVNDMRQLKAAMLLYYFYNQNVWPTEADIDKVDPYCDYPIVRANPPRYAAVMIKNGSIGVRLIPKNGDASVQAILAQNADKYWLWSNSEGTIAYKSGSEVWMRVYNIPQATDAADASPLLPFEYRDGDDHVSGKDYHYWYHAEDSPYHTMGVHFADHEGKRSKRESDLYAVDLNYSGGEANREVYAIEHGTVVYVRPDFGYVEIKHDKKLVTGVKYGLNQDKPLDGNLIEDGKPAWYSGYMHMADIRVKVGDEVEAGKTLGIISNVIKDGSVPVHLHFAVYDRDGYSFSPYFLPNNPANKITFQDIVYGGYNAEEKFKVGSFYVQADQDKFTNEKTDTSQGGVRYADYRNNK